MNLSGHGRQEVAMPFPISGASAGETGPAGCVVRFMVASSAGDSDAAFAELHPDHREGMAGGANAPPGIVSAEILPGEPGEGCQLVPTRLFGADGTEQRFVFVVRPAGENWGIDLAGSMEATFGVDPMQMMQDALTTAVAPLGEAVAQMGEAMGQAFSSDGGSSAPTARRIAADEPASTGAASLPTTLAARITELDLRRRVQRRDLDAPERSTELTVRCDFDLDQAWTPLACVGVTISEVTSIEGESLVPTEARSDLGSESYASWERENRACYTRIVLAAPQGPFTGLATPTGSIRLELVGGELLEIALGPVGDLVGHRHELAAIGLALEVLRDDDGQLTMRMPYGGFDRFEDVIPIDTNGETLNQSWGGSGDGETSTRTYSSEISDDARLVLRFWSSRTTAEVSFTAADLPLLLE